MDSKKQSLLALNIGIFVMTFAGIIAKIIPWSSEHVVLGRMLFAAIPLLAYLLLRKRKIALRDWKTVGVMALLGTMLAWHWVTYFISNKISTIAVAMIAVNTIPVMTTFLEPLFSKEKFHVKHIVLSLVAFVGVALMIEEYSFSNTVAQGVFFGLISALLMSLRNIWSRPYVQVYGGSVVMLWQLLLGLITLLPMLLTFDYEVRAQDIGWLILLGGVATALAHTLTIASLNTLSARTASMIGSIQPLYGIIFAYFIFTEIPTLRVLFGGIVVIGVVIAETLDQRKVEEPVLTE